MAIDFTKPATTDNYSTAFVPNIQGNQIALAQMLDSSLVTITGTPPTGAKQYNATTTGMQQWNGTAWVGITFQGITLGAGGNIGIGATPTAKLDMLGGYQAWRDGTYLAYMGKGSTLVGSGAAGDLALRVDTGNLLFVVGGSPSERMRIDSSGNVGIGTSVTASIKLNIDAGTQPIVANFNSTAANGAYARFSNSGTVIGDIGSGANLIGGGAALDFGINVRGLNNLIFGTNSVGRMSIGGAGNVTINAPGSGPALGVSSIAGGVAQTWSDGTTTAQVSLSGGLIFGTTTASVLGLYTTNSLRMQFASAGNVTVNAPVSGTTLQLAYAAGALAFDASGSGAAEGRIYATTDVSALIGLRNSSRYWQAGPVAGGSFALLDATRGATVLTADGTGQIGLGVAPVASGNNWGLLQLLGSANSGIFLGNTANAAKNVLDWYEEGTFTPVLKFGISTAGITYFVQTGTFMRVGNRVFFEITVVLTSKGSATGGAVISGLPYAIAADASASVSNYLVAATTSAPTAILVATTGNVHLTGSSTGSPGGLFNTDFLNNSQLTISGNYRT